MLTSLSIAGVVGNLEGFSSAEEVALLVASIKKEAKLIKGSCYLLKDIS